MIFVFTFKIEIDC